MVTLKKLGDWALGLWVALGMIIGFAMPPIIDKSSGLVLFSRQIGYFHIPTAIAMLLAFAISAYHGVMWLRRRQIRSDALSLAYAEVGMLLGIVATITGALFAKSNWGAYWSWDPQQVGVFVTLITYAALFSLRGAVEDSDKKRNLWAVYAIFGCLTSIFASVVYRRLLPDLQTLHPKNTLFKSDPKIQLALLWNIIGFVWLLVRTANLRARLEMASEQLKELIWAR